MPMAPLARPGPSWPACGIKFIDHGEAISIPAYKDELRNTWYASFYYTDWQGKRRLKKKRGFQRKKDALAFEDEFLKVRARSCDMTFRSFLEIYLKDMEPRLKQSTMQNKRYLYEHRILPFFGDLKLNEITSAHVRHWQSDLLAENVAPTYAKTINNQLSAVFNYACKYYGLGTNPVRMAGTIGKKNASEMSFWTVDEFNQFIGHVKKLPARTGLSVLFWTGLRIGELLALAPSDIDLEAHTLTVRRTFQTIDGKEIITEPKTPKSRRVVPLPEKLCEDIKAYMAALYEPQPDDRLFPYTKHYFRQQMLKGCQAAGMEPIRLHDLRHSHAALLIRLDTPILLVSERLGHEDIETTLRIYGHLYPSANDETVKKLDDLMR